MEDNNKEESNLTTCRLCQKIKLRRVVGKYPDGKNKKYADESGALWNGLVCPQCQQDRARNNMRRLRKHGKKLEV